MAVKIRHANGVEAEVSEKAARFYLANGWKVVDEVAERGADDIVAQLHREQDAVEDGPIEDSESGAAPAAPEKKTRNTRSKKS